MSSLSSTSTPAPLLKKEKSVTMEEGIAFPSPTNGTNNRKRGKRHKRSRSANRLPWPASNLAEAGPSKRAALEVDEDDDSKEQPLSSRVRSRDRASEYTVRPMQFKDLAAVYQLGNSIFTANEFPNMYRTWDDYAVAGMYEGSGDFCFLAEHEEDEDGKSVTTIVGFLLGESVTKANVGTRGYLQWVAVLPAFRRVGIATALINKFIQVGSEQSISLLLADTPADNEPAIQMFQKAGLSYKADHVYLTRQLKAQKELKFVDKDDMTFDFTYTAPKTKRKVTIRNIEIEDLYPIYSIGEKIFTKKSANLYNFWDESTVLQSYLSDPELCVVATVKVDGEDKVVGFAFGETIEKPRSSWKYGYLVWLGCAPEFQGIGVAKQLYNVMMELFTVEKVRMVMIDTQQNNEGALRFFRNLGFGHDEEHVYLCNVSMDNL